MDKALLAQLRDDSVACDIRRQHKTRLIRTIRTLIGLEMDELTWGVGDHEPERLAAHER